MSKSAVYANQNYEIVVNNDLNGYDIYNKNTYVKEGSSEVLPSAIGKADVWDKLMTEILEEIKARSAE